MFCWKSKIFRKVIKHLVAVTEFNFELKIQNSNRFTKELEKVLDLITNVLINTNTSNSKCIENTQYKYFSKVLKIQIVLKHCILGWNNDLDGTL